MAKYSIQDTSLIAIGDAIRNKTGEHTRIEYGPYIEIIPDITVSKTPNATGFDSHEGEHGNKRLYDVVRIPGASSIYVDIAVEVYLWSGAENVEIVAGEYDASNFPKGTGEKVYSSDINNKYIRKQITIPNTDVITLCFSPNASADRLGYYAECSGIDADGNPMGDTYVEREGEHEVKNTLTPAQMATEIEGLPTIPDEAFVVTGNCQYRFGYDGWNWFINNFGDKIITKDLTDIGNMFLRSYNLTNIPFDINVAKNTYGLNAVFQDTNIETAPYIKGEINPPTASYSVPSLASLFYNCNQLKYIPDDYFDQFGGDEFWTAAQNFPGGRNSLFSGCYSLRKIPSSYVKLINKQTSSYSHLYYSLCQSCYVIDEITNIPIEPTITFTSNFFSYTFGGLNRAHTILFETNEDGSPIAVNWKSQLMDLSNGVGYATSYIVITNNNSGITRDTEVIDDTTYQALKDHPDMWTTKMDYSRYNHDSAVATINSLPDTSAYLASAGGTNTIKFRGNAGALTDGGAINTLTEEEIAVAAAKGWTVSF